MNVCNTLLIAAMAISWLGPSLAGWCGCEHALEGPGMPSLCASCDNASCCGRCARDHDCCEAHKNRGAEPRSEGFPPQPRLDDDATAPQPTAGGMLRTAMEQHTRTGPAFTVDLLSPHLCTTILLI